VVIHSALYTGTPADFKEKGDQISFDSWDPLGLLSASSHSAFDERAQDSLFGFGGMMRTKSNKKSSSKNNKNSKKTENTSSNKRTTSSRQSTKTSAFGTSSGGDDDGNFGDFFSGDLPQKVATILALLVVSRIGAYIPISGVDRTAFAESLSNTGGVMSYVDTLTGGSISKLGIFSLGIVPFINSSIIFQLLSSVFPELQKLQKEEGESGRRQFMQYQRYGALAFALIQAVGQCLYVRPYVDDFSVMWLAESTAVLTAGAMILMYIGEVLNELKLGNGTSLLIFANIVSSLPSSIGQTVEQSKTDGNGAFTLAVFFGAFLLSTLGVVYVQEAERKIPMQYSTKFNSQGAGLSKSSYLPFKVNSAGVMPIIFSSSLMALPATLARFTDNGAVTSVAKFIYPGGAGYIPVNVALICFFNYFYTFLQLDPKDVAEQLKRQGASIPGVRPGKNTREYITRVLERLSLLGSLFLGFLALTPGGVEKLTGLQTFRGFAGTSLLILVGVATDCARKVKSELVMQKYSTSIEDFYKK
jgi:preprotein translocase SecY subunit